MDSELLDEEYFESLEKLLSENIVFSLKKEYDQ
jgi:hypothetical protein